MDAGLVFAVLALLVAFGGLLHSIRAIRHERADRLEELGLLRRQLALEQEDRDEQRRAYVDAVRGGTSWAEGRGEHEFELVNAGPATARDVRFWIEATDGTRVTEPTPTRARFLARDERATQLVDVRRPQPDPVFLVVAWQDGAGPQSRRVFELNADPVSQRKSS